MNRQTGIGLLFRASTQAAREEIAEVLRRNGGNIVRSAHDLAISRRHMYRLVYRANLWGVAESARVTRPDIPTEIRRARLML